MAIKHDGCAGCKHEHESKESLNCAGCKQNAVDMYERMTYADRIRVMSDIDLARMIACPNDTGFAEINCNKTDECDCYRCILNWLRQEVE